MLVSAILCVLIGRIAFFITTQTNSFFTKVFRPVKIILLALVVYVHLSPKLSKKSKAKLSVAHKPLVVIGHGRYVSISHRLSLFGYKTLSISIVLYGLSRKPSMWWFIDQPHMDRLGSSLLVSYSFSLFLERVV